MELKTFVSETLKQIIEGVVNAQAFAKEHQALVNPENLAQNIANKHAGFTVAEEFTGQRYLPYIQIIDFDVAITASTENSGEGGGGLFVAAATLGGRLKTVSSDQTVSRIKFSIPVQFPKDSVHPK